jgi:hypothetical protein
MRIALLALVAVFVIQNNRYFKLRTARRGKKLLVVAEQAARGGLNDRIVQVMVDTITSEYMDTYSIQEDLVHRAGLELAKHGTPESCLLAMYVSNYSGVKYPESTNEIIREAACNFTGIQDSRTVDIVRGKYLFEDTRTDLPLS